MSLFADFFKKDVTAYPSGRDVATKKKTRAKWSDEELSYRMGLAMVGTACVGAALFMGALVKSNIDKKVENHKHDYDSALLATIDSVAATGIPMENAIEKGFTLTNYRLEADDKDALKDHINYRLAEARDIADIKTNDLGDYDTVFAYKPEFRESLAHVVQVTQENKQNRCNCNQSHQNNHSSGGSFLNSAAGRAAMSTLIRGF